ncbi:hypothetical protein OW763_14105 [Clostridium aestuarii]|uniref:Uncharacterized protein n=1 Tax=Clostridium aestuarii TaxID=338193 RepID=A0ABT4D2I9_9CLOT|nr:hypothetical protein [Clostridium aestuarii]MCY6485463.1 hypothetical protein [Clostridium aestuarii]
MESMYKLMELNSRNLKEVFDFVCDDNQCIDKLLDKDVLIRLGFKYGIIYNFDSVITDKIQNIKIDKENIIEVRFFSYENEIRIFNNEGIYSGTIFYQNEDKDFFTEEYYLYPREKNKKKYPHKLEVKKYVNYDDTDKQAYISYVKPCSFEFKEVI